MKRKNQNGRTPRNWGVRLCLALVAVCSPQLSAQERDSVAVLQGVVRDADGHPSSNALVVVANLRSRTNDLGQYTLRVPAGTDTIEVRVGTATLFRVQLVISEDRTFDIELGEAQNVTVTAEPDALTPDPGTQAYAHGELLDANPGRPGVPVSIPGYPAETASGGIKAPQYFAPGVAGDHGEPIGQYIRIGSFLLPNNLTANAHGNGYADPNFLVSGVVGGVVVDGGAFNVRYGDHAINLAVTYDLRSNVSNSVQTSTTGRDVAFGGNVRLGKSGWIAAEGLLGNGWLQRPEERQQYKLDAYREWNLANHQLTLFGVGYYGFSRIPGLIPLGEAVPGGTVDERQSDLTHTSIGTLVDRWQISPTRSLASGVFFRTYSLKLRSDFGDGLIQQSEFRTVAGGSSTFAQQLGSRWTLLAGLEARREAPRGLELAKLAETTQQFTPVSKNDLSIYTVSPLSALSGRLLPGVQLYAGVRRDQLCFENKDLLDRGNSFDACPGITSPKVNLTFGSMRHQYLPQLALSFAKAFHANDPRIGTGTGRGQLIASAREYQVVLAKAFGTVQGRILVGQVGTSAEFAKIDADTGLQENVGPARNRFFTVQVNQRTTAHFWQLSWSEADARDRTDGSPLPEAPRMIVDGVIGINRLPLGLSGKTEFEYVKAKPLGDGFTGVPLQELRLELSKSLQDGRWTIFANGQWVRGYSGQTLETISLDSSPAYERPVGIPAASYATLAMRYNFDR